MAESKVKIAAAQAKIASAAMQAMDKIVKKTVLHKKAGLGRDSHKKRVLNALPAVGVVNMSRGATEWRPLCVIRTGTKNVAMQSTTDNFTKLFEMVRQCLCEQAALKESEVQTLVRTLRRRKSNPHHPKGPPNERQYYSKSKGIWITKTLKEETTPPSGSGTHYGAGRNRRFLKSQTANPTSRSSGPRPGGKYRCPPGTKKSKQRVLSGDADPEPGDDDDDCASSSHDLFSE
jgi:hypothetical protein